MSEFVFKKAEDGKLRFVGDFEGLYRAEKDPWHQSAEMVDSASAEMISYYVASRSLLLSTVRRYINNRTCFGLEIGCGHGHVTEFLNTSAVPSIWHGMDISPTAILAARTRYPTREFFTGDIMQPAILEKQTSPYRIVLLGQILWYVLHELPRALITCHKLLMEDGFLIVSQAFLEDAEQLYGREIALGFAGLLKLLLTDALYSGLFRVIEAKYDDVGVGSSPHRYHDGIIVLRKKQI